MDGHRRKHFARISTLFFPALHSYRPVWWMEMRWRPCVPFQLGRFLEDVCPGVGVVLAFGLWRAWPCPIERRCLGGAGRLYLFQNVSSQQTFSWTGYTCLLETDLLQTVSLLTS